MARPTSFLLGFMFFTATFSSGLAMAAQIGRVTVDEASLREFPQSGARVLAKIKKNEEVTVSNVPTEGFYKTRIRTGEIGWISGNEILVGGAAVSAAKGRSKARAPSKAEGIRFHAGYGLNFGGYGGMSSVLNTNGLSNTTLMLEADFKLSDKLYLAARFSMISGTSAATAVTQVGGTAASQVLKDSLMPIEVGATYTFMRTESLRVLVGLYGGMSVSSTMTVDQTVPNVQLDEVKYNSVDPSGTINLQGAYAFSDLLGVFLEAGYHYQPTGAFVATQHLGGVAGFSIDYSGPLVLAGLELKL